MQGRRDPEFAAIPIVVVIMGILFVVIAAASVGLWAWFVVGAAGLVVCAVLVRSATSRRRHPPADDVPRGAPAAPDASVHRLLVIADVGSTPESLRGVVGGQPAGRRTEAFVVAPALSSRLGRLTGDQAAYDDATRHLEATLSALAELGVEARGRLGPHDPIQAADDGLREFPADTIVLAVNADSSANWLEQGVVETARDRYDIPVVVAAAGR